MKERLPEMPKITFALVGIACFLILSFTAFLNTYRIFLLDAEIYELRQMLEKCSTLKALENGNSYNEKLSNLITRERRSVVDQDDSNISRNQFLSIKGAFSNLERDTTLKTIYKNHKGASQLKSLPIDTRKPKVMQFDNSARNLIKTMALKSLDSGYNSNEFNSENPLSEFSIIRNEEVVTRRSRSRMQNLDERHPRTGRIKPLPSIHLSGDTSRYVLGTHQNFKGNGHLTHIQSIFVDWVPNSWVEKTGMMSHFSFDHGYLTIKESGLYLIYAQIYYLDEHDLNGYRVYKNDDIILQCTISLHSITRAQKGNTCYTAGVEYVAEGDKISLGDILNGHYSLFEPGKSFFGLVKLGDVRARI